MNNQISNEVEEAVKKALERDPAAKKIHEITMKINKKRWEVYELEAELSILNKSRQEIPIKLRESAMWCLQIDSLNPRYFLKSASGVYKCIAYKHKIELTTTIKNKIATTLSMMFKESIVGRIQHNNVFYYGLKEFFEPDLITLKREHAEKLNMLQEVNV